VFSNGEHDSLCKDFEREFGHVADCHVVPIDARVGEIFDKEGEFIVFLRPDNHIAFISSEISSNAARDYLNRIAER
jgi:hypothetical protein